MALKAPFPWFGGKSRAAPAVWAALGDVEHYVEPFAGSLAVLLGRPHEANRAYFSETVNDADAFLVNAWRAMQLKPAAVADACSWPVSECDLHARHLALLRWREDRQPAHLMGDPQWCDAQMAGWWLYGLACWIGAGWCSGAGPWTADQAGRIVKAGREMSREPGISRHLPAISKDGQGVHAPQLRSPGIWRQLPAISDNGKGVAHPNLREPGNAYQPRVMPKLDAWFAALSARLRHVRIVCGDWQRVVTGGALDTLSVRKGGTVGVFLDPPYAAETGRDMGLYTVESGEVSAAVRAWALEHGERPRTRIVLAGWAGEHDFEAAGWRCVEWFSGGFLTGGYANQGANGTNQARERLWLSPGCLRDRRQLDLFGDAA